MRALATVLVMFLLSTDALGRAMATRHQAPRHPGYNSGLGRFVDQDRRLSLEVDGVTALTAEVNRGAENRIDEWLAEIQYSIGSVAVGLEFWYGDHRKETPGDEGATLARDEFYLINGNRYQLWATRYSNQNRMQGWFIKGGISYTRIDTRLQLLHTPGTALTEQRSYSVIDEQRYGPAVGVGKRWGFWKNRSSVALGANFTRSLQRSVRSSERADPNLERYDSILANAGGRKIAPGDFPEVRLSFGVLF